MTLFDLLTATAKADTELLRSNDRQGDVFTVSREVDFAFQTRERDDANAFAEFVNGKQYGVAEVFPLEDGAYHIAVLITTPITQHVICSISALMVCLSRIFKIDYQGWGSVMQS